MSSTPDARTRLDPPGFDRLLEIRNFGSLVRNWRVDPIPHPDGQRLAWVDDAPDGRQAWIVDLATGQHSPLFDAAKAGQAVAEALGLDAPTPMPPRTFAFVGEGGAIRFEVGAAVVDLDLDTCQASVLSGAPLSSWQRRKPRVSIPGLVEGQPDLPEVTSPDGGWQLGQRGRIDPNLWLRSTVDDRFRQLTEDGEEDHAWTSIGAIWSPDSSLVAALRVDTRGMAKVPIVHWLQAVEQVDEVPYAKAGGRMPTTSLWVIDVRSGARTAVHAETVAGDSIIPLRFSADGARLDLLTVSRRATDVRLRSADTSTGESWVVIHEHQDTFVVNIPPALWAAQLPRFVGDDVLWLTERSGFRHVHRFGMDGTDHGPVTAGEWVVDRIAAVDAVRRRAWLVAHTDPERPYDKHVCLVDLDRDEPCPLTELRVLTTEPGIHSPVVAGDGSVALDTHSGVSRPPRVDLLGDDGRLRATLSAADTSRLDALGWTPPTEFTALAADGETELWGAMYHPPGFDPTRKHPVIEFIYAGPQGTVHPQDFLQTRAELANELAQLGFVTVVTDARGTPERSKAFMDVVHRRFGQHEIPDHAAVLRQLGERHPFLDMERVGITGRSWGGYMTLRALLLAPDVYTAGAMMYGVGELWDHAAAAIEPYMGLPAENPDGYRAADSLARIGDLQGSLLIGHGTSDLNATFSASMKVVEALTRAGKPYELVVLPETGHTTDGMHGEYWYRRLSEFFVRTLRPDLRPPI